MIGVGNLPDTRLRHTAPVKNRDHAHIMAARICGHCVDGREIWIQKRRLSGGEGGVSFFVHMCKHEKTGVPAGGTPVEV